jgi:glycosyltransferase involved in cell wall biosynthesis
VGAKVSLVTTVKDSADRVGAFLDSVREQTRPPDEVVVVDGGSTDGTLDVLRASPGIRLLEEPGANISRGRNIAIEAAAHDVLAVSDADCVLEPEWLERLLVPIEAGADVAMGAYVPLTDGSASRWMGAVNIPAPAELDEATFMPSSRSVAFTRRAIDAAGGYPEWLDIGEDMYVDHRWRDLGLDMRLARDAVVRWPLRRGPAATWRQYFGYARGDAIARMHSGRHALRFATYGLLLAAALSPRAWPKWLAVAAGAAYAGRPVARAVQAAPSPAERVIGAAAVPVIMAFLDAAKMAGFAAGALRRRRAAGRRYAAR